MMRIAFIGLHFCEYSLNLSLALAREHDVLLFLSEKNFHDELGCEQPHADTTSLRVRMLPHYASPALVLKNAWTLVKEIMRFGPDVIHCHEDPKDYLALALPFLRRYPFMLTIHDPQYHQGSDSKNMKRRYRRYLRDMRDRCDGVFVHGQLLKQQLQSLLPRLQDRVWVVPHGPLGPQQANALTDWEPGVVLFFGRMEEYKGLDMFIAAIRQLADEGKPVKGIAAGRGADLDRHRHRLSHPAFELIERYIPREQTINLFRRANVVVLPYKEGTQSGVAAMAMGFGRAVVATRVGSLPELVIDGQTGIIVPPGEVSALAAAIWRLVSNRRECEDLSRRSHAASRGEYSWAKVAELTVVGYARLLRVS
jgi:glycosyltransferase involved in cell wall biosynthesis